MRGPEKRATRPARPRLPLARAIVGVIFFTSCLGWFAYFFLFSDNFQIKTVSIEGNKNIPGPELAAIIDATLAEERWVVFPNRSSLLVSTGSVADAIRKQYIVDNISVRRKPPFSLSVQLTEKLSRVVLRVKTPVQIIQAEEGTGEGPDASSAASTTLEEVSYNNVTNHDAAEERVTEYAETLYYLDVNGIAVSLLPASTDLASLPIIEIIRDRQSEINPGDAVLNREIVELIFSLYERLLAASSSIAIAYVSYDPGVPQEFRFTTQEGWQAFLSAQIPLETQIQKLELALQEKIKENRATLQYVDLRVKDRVYFK